MRKKNSMEFIHQNKNYEYEKNVVSKRKNVIEIKNKRSCHRFATLLKPLKKYTYMHTFLLFIQSIWYGRNFQPKKNAHTQTQTQLNKRRRQPASKLTIQSFRKHFVLLVKKYNLRDHSNKIRRIYFTMHRKKCSINVLFLFDCWLCAVWCGEHVIIAYVYTRKKTQLKMKNIIIQKQQQ